jgi:hypothetical protein
MRPIRSCRSWLPISHRYCDLTITSQIAARRHTSPKPSRTAPLLSIRIEFVRELSGRFVIDKKADLCALSQLNCDHVPIDVCTRCYLRREDSTSIDRSQEALPRTKNGLLPKKYAVIGDAYLGSTSHRKVNLFELSSKCPHLEEIVDCVIYFDEDDDRKPRRGGRDVLGNPQ